MTAIGDLNTHRAQREGRATLQRPDGQLVWLHFSDVNNVLDCAELVRNIEQHDDTAVILFTTDENKPVENLRAKLPRGAVHQYLPDDQLEYVTAFLQFWQPSVCIWFSDELNPVLLAEADKQETLLVYANANPPQLTGLRRIFPNRQTALYKSFDHVLAVSKEAKKNCTRMGVAENKIVIMPPIQSGGEALHCDEPERAKIARTLSSRPVWFGFGITEDELGFLIEAQKYTARRAQRLLLIVQPKHKSLAEGFVEKFRAQGFVTTLRSQSAEPKPETQVFVIDTKNEEGLWLRISPVTFMGGSMSNVQEVDPLGAAALGSAIIHGDQISRHMRSYQRLKDGGATVEITQGDQLAAALADVISPDRAASMAQAAWNVGSIGAQTTDYLFSYVEDALTTADATA